MKYNGNLYNKQDIYIEWNINGHIYNKQDIYIEWNIMGIYIINKTFTSNEI